MMVNPNLKVVKTSQVRVFVFNDLQIAFEWPEQY